MNIPEHFIRRPVMTTLITAAVTLFGWMAYQKLPVSELPNVDFPTHRHLQVKTTPQVVDRATHLKGIRYIKGHGEDNATDTEFRAILQP